MTTAARIDGTAIAREVRAEVARRAARLASAGQAPGLAVILVGDDPASQVYVRNKVKACAEAGIRSIQENYPADLAEAALLARIAALNADDTVHGILVQMPLPPQISAQRVIEAIAASKDVDGYSVESAGRLLAGLPGFKPCTPWGCMKLIESTGIALRGKLAVVIGRSNTVGKPMALMLLQADATVTVFARPTAATTTSARRVCSARSGVRLWQIVTVASAWRRSSAIGLPTVLLRPMTTACLPRRSMPVLSISLMQPAGVHGRNPGRPAMSRPALSTE